MNREQYNSDTRYEESVSQHGNYLAYKMSLQIDNTEVAQ